MYSPSANKRAGQASLIAKVAQYKKDMRLHIHIAISTLSRFENKGLSPHKWKITLIPTQKTTYPIQIVVILLKIKDIL